jgi:hypothetical protein
MASRVKVGSAMPWEAVVEVKYGVEEGVVLMGVAFRELPFGRSRWRLPQSRDRGLQGSTHCGYCVHGSHLLPMDHDRRNASTRRRDGQPARGQLAAGPAPPSSPGADLAARQRACRPGPP